LLGHADKGSRPYNLRADATSLRRAQSQNGFIFAMSVGAEDDVKLIAPRAVLRKFPL